MPARVIQVGDRLTDNQVYDIHIAQVYRGGLGIVAVGTDAAREDEAVALKMPHPALLRSRRFVELFERECLTWIGVWPHPNVVKARYLLDLNGFRVLALNYANQGDLRCHLRKALPLGQALLWAEHIACGLHHIHTPDPDHMRPQPIVHRDLKPENILINARGFALITDFGLAKAFDVSVGKVNNSLAHEAEFEKLGSNGDIHHTRSRVIKTQRGAVLGTLAYMPWEQWEDAASAGPPADMYAFGIILSELIARRHPLIDALSAESLTAEDWQAIHKSPRPLSLREVEPSLPKPAEEVYLACLAPDPQCRPTAAEALEILRLAVQSHSSESSDIPVADERTPENEFRFWHNWTNAYVDVTNYAEALPRNDRALHVDSASPAVWLTRGNIFRCTNQLDDSEAAYESALQLAEPEDALTIGKIKYGISQLYTRRERFSEADTLIGEVLAIDDRLPKAWQIRSNNQLRWAKYWVRNRDFMRAHEHTELGLAYLRKSISDGWRPRDSELLECYLLAEQGNVLKYQRRFAEAEEAYAQAFKAVAGILDFSLDHSLGLRTIWYNRAINQRMWAESLIDASSTDAEAHVNRGLEYLEPSLHITRKILGTNDSGGDRIRVDLLILRGRIASMLGKYHDAETVFSTALATLLGLPGKEPPNGARIIVQQAINYKLWGGREVRNQHTDEALSCFQRGLHALESLPEAELASPVAVALRSQLASLLSEAQSDRDNDG